MKNMLYYRQNPYVEYLSKFCFHYVYTILPSTSICNKEYVYSYSWNGRLAITNSFYNGFLKDR